MDRLADFLSVPVTIGLLVLLFIPLLYRQNRRISLLEDEIEKLKKEKR